MADKRDIEIKAKHKGMFLKPCKTNDPNDVDNATYWLVDETTDLPVIVDPVSLNQIDETLDSHPDKDAGDPRPDPEYGDGSEA